MRAVAGTQANQNIREIGAKLTFRDNRLRFAPSAVAFNPLGTITFIDSDVNPLNGNILMLAGNEAAYMKGEWDGVSEMTWEYLGGLAIWPGARPAVFGNHFFLQHNLDIVRLQYQADGTAVPAVVSSGHAAPLAIAPVSPDEFYYLEVFTDGVNPYGYGKITYVNSTTATTRQWPGRIYGKSLTLGPIDAYRYEGLDYIFLTDSGDRRTIYLKSDVGTCWSEINQVVPMDVVDDVSQFALTGAGIVGDKPMVFGTLKRTYGLAMEVYLIGPEAFTFGRDLFVRKAHGKVGGKLHLLGDQVVYLAADTPYIAQATPLVGFDNPGKQYSTENIRSYRLSASPSAPMQLDVDAKASEDHPAIRTGAEVTLEAVVNGETSQLGVFSADALLRSAGESGGELSITLRSAAMKALADWKSDASYDYWSQTKLSDNPKELTSVLRVTGKYLEDSGGLGLEDLNSDGYLYVNAKSARGAQVSGKFLFKSGDFGTKFGVGVNYYRETKYEAAQRLGKESADVRDDECGHNGIFVLYDQPYNNATGTLKLVSVFNSIELELASTPLTLARDAWHYLMLKFTDGLCEVYTRPEIEAGWTKRITYTFENYERMPWNKTFYLNGETKREQLGCGAILLHNATRKTTAYGFQSTDDFVPVADHSLFPASDTISIDSEQISYTGKAGSLPIDNLAFRWGNTALQVTGTTGPDVSFANVRDTNYCIQTFGLAATIYSPGVWVYVRKIGHPEDGLVVSIYRGGKTKDQPLGGRVCSVTIPSENISANYQWLWAGWGSRQEIKPGDYIIMTRAKDAMWPNAENHYQTLGLPNPYGAGKFWLFSDNSDNWHIDIECDMPFKVVAADQPPGGKYNMHIAWDARLSTAANAYTNWALVVTDGPGKGQAYKIVGYKWNASPKTCVLYFEKAPSSLINESSVLAIVPALTGVIRGANSTTRAAHSTGATVHLYRAAPYTAMRRVAYYSNEPDIPLAEMVHKISRKAGVLQCEQRSILPATVTPAVGSDRYEIPNPIVHLQLPSDVGIASVQLRAALDGLGMGGVVLTITDASLSCTTGTYAESFPLAAPLTGETLVSFFDNSVSVWNKGRHVHSFDANTADGGAITSTNRYFEIGGTYAGPIGVYVPEANVRVDNFILDAGQSGMGLLSTLIGEKRLWLQETYDGKIRVYGARDTLNAAETPYRLTVDDVGTESEMGLVTRVRLEGAEVAEAFDEAMLAEHGNLYLQANMHEINSEIDARYYVGKTLEDAALGSKTRGFSGAADPRVEPNDELYVLLPDGVKRVVADTVDFRMAASEDDAAFDMTINGRVRD